MASSYDEYLEFLESEEASRDDVYPDSEGFLTAGIGHKLTDEELKKYKEGDIVPQDVRDKWFNKDAKEAWDAAQSQNSQIKNPIDDKVLGSVNFQLGTNWTTHHPKTWQAMLDGDNEAAAEIVGQNADNTGDSLWKTQTPDRVEVFSNALLDSAGAGTLMAQNNPTTNTDPGSPVPAGKSASSIMSQFLSSQNTYTPTTLSGANSAGTQTSVNTTPPQSAPPAASNMGTQTSSRSYAPGGPGGHVERALLRPSAGQGYLLPKEQQIEKFAPTFLGEKFTDSVMGGYLTLEADVQRAGAIVNLLTGNEKKTKEYLNKAKYLDEASGELLGSFGNFEEFLEAPTFAGFVDLAV